MVGRRHGFTLIESVIALTVLALVAGACFELRAQSLAQTRAITGRQANARVAHTILTLAWAGQLGQGRRVERDELAGVVEWAGERDGRLYTLVREPVVVANPLRDSVGEDAASAYPVTVDLFRYTLELEGETYTVEWAR